MIWRKILDELGAFWAEVFVENRPRYRDWKEWPHLYVDFWVSLFGMSYTLGHIAAVVIPVAIVWSLF